MAFKLIGICGGIGSGKSVVSRVLRLTGYEVYDCDVCARLLMESDSGIKCRIRDEISTEVTDGASVPDRRLLASIVFANEEKRRILNSIVHSEVRRDVALHGEHVRGLMFVEAAVLSESGLADMCDAIWLVEAPLSRRQERVTQRDSCTQDAFSARVKSQKQEGELLKRYRGKTVEIYNDGLHSLLQQITHLLDGLKRGADKGVSSNWI